MWALSTATSAVRFTRTTATLVAGNCATTAPPWERDKSCNWPRTRNTARPAAMPKAGHSRRGSVRKEGHKRRQMPGVSGAPAETRRRWSDAENPSSGASTLSSRSRSRRSRPSLPPVVFMNLSLEGVTKATRRVFPVPREGPSARLPLLRRGAGGDGSGRGRGAT